MTKRCVELVKEFEGFSSRPYRDPVGVLTTGYGHVVKLPQEQWLVDKELTKEEAELLLIRDLFHVEGMIIPKIKVAIHPWMMDALVSFAYNVGAYAFRASTLRQKLNRKEFRDAADEFLRWVYAGGRKLKGLVRRRQAERALFLEGVEEMEMWSFQ